MSPAACPPYCITFILACWGHLIPCDRTMSPLAALHSYSCYHRFPRGYGIAALHSLNDLVFCCRLMSNMVIYMTRIMGYEPAFASVQLMLFEGTCYLTPILGAWLADSAWGRFKTILVFSIIYFLVRSPHVARCHAPFTLREGSLCRQWHVSGSVALAASGTCSLASVVGRVTCTSDRLTCT